MILFWELKDNAAGLLAIDSYREQSALQNDGKVIIVLVGIVPADQVQGLTELEHCRELMLAAVAAEAGTGQTADHTIAELKLHLVRLGALDDSTAVGTIHAQMSDN